ncbi:MAG: HD domain-containing protein [Bacteroidales bacterium]|nr:HD domain-containing protein [Bacteroidales bacterium]
MIRNFHDEIVAFLETEIVPLYDNFDAGHQRDHAHAVMETSHRLAKFYPEVDETMLLVAAAYHDVGLAKGREHHHTDSAIFMRADERLLSWFTPEEIDLMADAAEDHRASSTHAPRTIYGRLVAESDRQIVPETVIIRTMQYSRSHFPGLDKEGQWQRLLEHLHEKYAEGGYLQLWIPESDNAHRLAELRTLINDTPRLRATFDTLYNKI